MNYNNLNIPKNQRENFKFFLHLPNAVRNQFIEKIKDSPKGLSTIALHDYFYDNIDNLSNEKIGALISIYENLSEAKDDMGYDDNEFIQDLTNALIDTEDPELVPTEESISIFKNLFSSSNNLYTSRKIHGEQLENEKNYDTSKVIVDIRPVFDNDNFIGSTIVNKLKIKFKENYEEKSFFITLDSDDIVDLIENLKKAQIQNNYIQDNFNNINIINIK